MCVAQHVKVRSTLKNLPRNRLHIVQCALLVDNPGAQEWTRVHREWAVLGAGGGCAAGCDVPQLCPRGSETQPAVVATVLPLLDDIRLGRKPKLSLVKRRVSAYGVGKTFLYVLGEIVVL